MRYLIEVKLTHQDLTGTYGYEKILDCVDISTITECIDRAAGEFVGPLQKDVGTSRHPAGIVLSKIEKTVVVGDEPVEGRAVLSFEFKRHPTKLTMYSLTCHTKVEWSVDFEVDFD